MKITGALDAIMTKYIDCAYDYEVYLQRIFMEVNND